MLTIKWGILGLGKIAHHFAESFEEIKNAKLLSIASRNEININNFKKKFNISQEFCFDNYLDLINNKEIDIVYISLPHSLHYKWVTECIKNYKNILVEKPAVISVGDVSDIKERLKSKKIFFAESFLYRYHPQTQVVIDIIKNEDVGELLSMSSFFGSDIITKKKFFGLIKKIKISKNNRLFNKELGGGAIWDIGCYPTSMSLLIAGLKSKINGNIEILNSRIIKNPAEVDLESFAELKFENDFKSKIGCSFKSNLGQSTTINGSKCKIVINNSWNCKNKVIRLNQKEYKIEKKYNNNFSYVIEKISEYLINGKTEPDFPGMRLKDSITNIEILEKWQNSYE